MILDLNWLTEACLNLIPDLICFVYCTACGIIGAVGALAVLNDDSVDMPEVDQTATVEVDQSDLLDGSIFEEKAPNPVAVVLGILCNIVYIVICVKIKTSMDVDDVENIHLYKNIYLYALGGAFGI